MVNFKNEEAPYLSAENLNKMQTDLQAPIGSIEINDGVDPSTYFEGTWEKQEMFLGGELIAFGSGTSTASNLSSIAPNSTLAFSDIKIPNKEFSITNYIDDILTQASGTLYLKPKNVVGLIDIDISFGGLAGTTFDGLWFRGNSNDLPNGVNIIAGYGALMNLNKNTYGSVANNYQYKVDEDAIFKDTDGFFINPSAIVYNGDFTPCSGGVRSFLAVKVLAKKGATIWKRIS